VVAYVGGYSHRIALSDGRILAFTDGQVDLAYKDYRDGQNKVMPLDAEELRRRYLLDVLPKGFMRCRTTAFPPTAAGASAWRRSVRRSRRGRLNR
jgi:hypothetical protein